MAAGLDVLVDLHFPSDTAKTLVLSDPASFAAYKTFAASMAAHLAATRPLNRVALELFNEPYAPASGIYAGNTTWPALQAKLYAAVRAAAPTLLLVLTGDDFSSASALSVLKPVDDGTPVAYTFHFYDPTPFTEQGATWAWYLLPVGNPSHPFKFLVLIDGPLTGVQGSLLAFSKLKNGCYLLGLGKEGQIVLAHGAIHCSIANMLMLASSR